MKAKVIKIKKPIIFSSILAILFLLGISTILFDQIDMVSFETKEVSGKASKIQDDKIKENKIEIKNNQKNSKKEYENFPREYRGYPVIGKISIPKLNIEKYILAETTDESLKASVARNYGPKVNEIGNLCISGHNYSQTFGKLKELEIGDKIILTDTYNESVNYQVYKIYKVNPNDTSCLSQETGGEREITLITCTLGAIKRNVVKAIEVYD